MKNTDLRKRISESGVCYWEIAEAIGIHPSTLSTKLRRELPEAEKAELYKVIDRLAEGKEVQA